MSRTWLDDLTLQTVLVHTTNDMTFRGLKSSVYDDCIVLREARVLETESISAVLEGEVVIPREQVHFMQVLKGDDA